MAKKLLFWLLLLLIPAIVLVGLEITLGLFGYGLSFRLTRSLVRNDVDYRQVERMFPTKYFSISRIAQKPQFRETIFPAVKREGTFRIIALGGSSTFGFPYPYNLDFPSILQFLLNRSSSSRDFEVINLSTSAINSHSVVEIAEEALELQPDLLLIYMGHNEFYGALGSGSTEQVPGGEQLTRLYLWLKEFRTFQLVAESVSALRPSNLEVSKDETLMSVVVREQTIPLDSPMVGETAAQFGRNLDRIGALARNKGVPVVIGTPVSNLQDQPPFVPILPPDAEPREELLDRFGRTPDADRWLRRYARDDSSSALYHYFRGSRDLAAGKVDDAYDAFLLAKELDGLRFRAPASIGEKIRERCASRPEWTLVDLEPVFRKASASGVPGKDLFLEHLHPNVRGAFFLASSFADSIRAEILGETGTAAAELDFTGFLREYPVTRFDQTVARLMVQKLTAGWPFRATPRPFRFDPTDFEETQALNFHNLKVSWGRAMQDCLNERQEAGDLAGAARYAHAIQLADPYQDGGYLLRARILTLMDDRPGARAVLADGLAALPDATRLQELSRSLRPRGDDG